MARLRVQWSDSADAPAETRVLFRQRMGWVMLLGAYVALLCLPAYRRMMTTQAEGAWAGRPPEWAALSGPARARMTERLREVLQRNPQDAWLALGGVSSVERNGSLEVDASAVDQKSPIFDPTRIQDPRIEYMRELRQRFPQDIGVTAQALRFYSQNHIKIQRAEIQRDVPGMEPKPTRLLAVSAVKEVEELGAAGRRLEPENGYFPTLLATAYFAAGRDEDGLRELRAASHCSTWRDHAFREGLAHRDLVIRAYGDHGLVMHMQSVAMVLLPHFSQIRQAARMAVWRSEQARRQGDTRREHELRADVIRLGALMRRQTDSLIGRLVGSAIEDLAFVPKPTRHLARESEEEMEARKLREREAYIAQVHREAPELVSLLRMESSALSAFRREVRTDFISADWDRIVRPATLREMAGMLFQANLGSTLALWAGCALLLALWPHPKRKSETESREGVTGSAPGWLRIAAVVLAPLAVVIPAAGLALGNSGLSAVAMMGVGMAGLLWALRPRKQPDVEWTWVHGLLVALPALALAAFVCTLAASTRSLDTAWRFVLPHLALTNGETGQPETAELAIVYLTPVLGIVGAGLVLSAIRRAGGRSAVQGIAGGARSLSGILAVGYLVYLLAAVPANLSAARQFDQLVQQEIEGGQSTFPHARRDRG